MQYVENIYYALSIWGYRLADAKCACFYNDKKIFNNNFFDSFMKRRFEWWIYYEYYKCTFLIIHICIGHIAIKIRMLMSHTYTPGYSLSFLVFYTKISSLLKFVQQSMPSSKKAWSSGSNIKVSIDKFYSLDENR